MINGSPSTPWGMPESAGLPQGVEGAALIKAGSSTELRENLPVRAQRVPGGYQPSLPSELEFVIEGLVFADGSYEGDVASKYRAFVCGRKLEFKRLIPALDAALLEADPDPVNGPAKLRLRVRALSPDIDESDLAALAQAFPNLDRNALRGSTEVAVHGARKTLLDELEKFEHRRPADDFLTWLSATKTRYAAWLSRL